MLRVLPPALLEHIIPRRRVIAADPLPDGYRNSNFKLRFDGAEPLVLRVYEHDPGLCRKELDLLRLVAGAVPVPAVIDATPDGLDDFPPFALLRFVEGISFRELRRCGSQEAIAQAARSAGEVLAAIGRFGFPKPGWLAPGPTVTTPLVEGADPIPRFVDQCLASRFLQARVPPDLRDRIRDVIWRFAGHLAPACQEARLAHGDFNRRNLLVRQVAGRWQVAAVLDWEFAVSGSPLMDIGNFLRYERSGRPEAEPHFSSGYAHAGGILPEDWRRLARLIDLTASCATLADPETPPAVTGEVLELVRSALAAIV